MTEPVAGILLAGGQSRRMGGGDKCLRALAGRPILAHVIDLARQANLTLVGRAKGKRFVALAGEQRIVYDLDPAAVAEEDKRHQRKGGRADDAA